MINGGEGDMLTLFVTACLCSPVNMVLQYLQFGWWNDRAHGYEGGGYLFGERMYQIQSLVSKSLLLWLVVGGANQPNSYAK